jgi:branched-chain amino acid transport system ATP-binding protein
MFKPVDSHLPAAWESRGEVLSFFPRPGEQGKSQTEEVLLSVRDICVQFGGVKAVDSMSLQVRAGEIHALVGPNGAGKSTMLNSICGFYKPQHGTIEFQGKEITGLRPDQIAKLGVARVFQRIELFRRMTVLENILVGRHRFMETGVLAAGLFWGAGYRTESIHQQKVEEIIEFLNLSRYRKTLVGSLSYGLQKRVEIGRALASEPSLLLLDEPVAGMNLEEKEDVTRYLLDIHDEVKLSMVLVEHEMDVVMDISDRVTVMNFGRLVVSDEPGAVRRHPEVIASYLGA